VAQEWGFRNTACFVRNYKEMFGELPSKTLRANLQSSNP
jgi:AraC family transcriptional regulator, ethanolamine operon transcriptional activator